MDNKVYLYSILPGQHSRRSCRQDRERRSPASARGQSSESRSWWCRGGCRCWCSRGSSDRPRTVWEQRWGRPSCWCRGWGRLRLACPCPRPGVGPSVCLGRGSRGCRGRWDWCRWSPTSPWRWSCRSPWHRSSWSCPPARSSLWSPRWCRS